MPHCVISVLIFSVLPSAADPPEQEIKAKPQPKKGAAKAKPGKKAAKPAGKKAAAKAAQSDDEMVEADIEVMHSLVNSRHLQSFLTKCPACRMLMTCRIVVIAFSHTGT